MLHAVLVGGLLGWPEDRVRDTLLIVIFVVLAIIVPLVFIITRAYYKKSAERSSRWNMMMNQGLRRGLIPAEIKHLRTFFDTLTTGEVDDLIAHPGRYKRQLLEFLRHDPTASARGDVQLFDKLFPEVEWHIEINSAKDLQIGEVCTVEFPAETFLGTVLKVQENEILISIPEWIPSNSRITGGESTGLFVYRPGIGGFLLSGKVGKAGRNGFVYQHDGKVESKGEHHLMAIVELPCVLVPWPHKEEEPGPGGGAATLSGPSVLSVTPGRDVSAVGRGAPRTSADLPDQIKIRSVRISDRGMIFRAESVVQSMKAKEVAAAQTNIPTDDEVEPLTPTKAHDILKKSEIWELQLTLEDGYNFVCRVRAIPSNMGRGHFLMKFLDAPETGRKVLMQVIRRSDPMREQLV
ncbi:MAG: hypothetical protein HY042_02020 [Spirochaetia bacterium]|nr:hypothetical protein [Spirochaetia bacterium]